MKLYTEEVLRNSMLSMITYIEKYNENVIDKIVENHIHSLTPIELPSDEEIEEYVEDDFLNATEVHKYSEGTQLLMKAMCKAGALWMRDKIQGGNK